MTDRSDAGRRELGEFLRSRREEVAALAGVGVTWYTWLEQRRSINASAQVLQAICRTLRLDDAERRHAWTLAGPPTPDEPVVEQPGLTAAFQPVLDKLDPFPACVQNPRFDVLAYNRNYRFLFGDPDAIPSDERNCLRQFFRNPTWRASYLDDDIVAARMTAKFRTAVGA